MNSTFIRLWDVLEIMDSMDSQGKPVRFQLKFVTTNRLERTGGEIIELKDACKCSVRTKKKKEIFAAKRTFLEKVVIPKDYSSWPWHPGVTTIYFLRFKLFQQFKVFL